ncbi:REP element-mobilizing transposase RayT [Desulfoscipio geothermicus DSM 3669]|uniref:REP element-mobilizing transposase RayT n=2 Tax=Desulfoscipio geothermicus TaxID=39060 RepID=A0A1I6CPP0_9FIRM|nr:REP element-mobilizing transposase RayT [Desulfoscipio geothermicus DSM 3669]
MIRGNERKDIFLDEEDKQRFCDILKEKMRNGEFTVYALCIMDNHAHLLLKVENDRLANIMKRINTSYAYYYNKKYQRVGHVFQDRFKSEAIENESYLLAAIRYIHNNPVKAGMVKAPRHYKWSSYGSYTGRGSLEDDIIEKNMVLEMFSSEKGKAVELFVEYMNQLNNDTFIECEEEEKNKTILCEKDAREFVDTYLKGKGLHWGMLNVRANYEIRNEIIKELKEKSNLSIRQIAGLLGINKNTVLKV